jgi:hypothetical protein
VNRPLFRSQAEPAPDPLLAFGRLSQAVKHLSRQLAQLPDGRTDYYGTLQTMRATAIALTVDLGELIDACEPAAAEPALEVVRAHKLPSSDQPPAKEKRGRGRPPRIDPGPKPEEEGGHVTLREKIIRVLKSKGPQTSAKVSNHLHAGGDDVDLSMVERLLFLAKRDGKLTEDDGLWSVR